MHGSLANLTQSKLSTLFRVYISTPEPSILPDMEKVLFKKNVGLKMVSESYC